MSTYFSRTPHRGPGSPWIRNRITAQSYEPCLDPPEIPPRDLKEGMIVFYEDRWMSIHAIEEGMVLLQDKDLTEEIWLSRDHAQSLEQLEP